VAAALAGLVVGDAQRHGPHLGAQLARVEEVAEELADVEHARTHERQVGVVHVQDLARLPLQHQAAAGQAGDDRVPLARVWREPGDEVTHVVPSRLEAPVRLQRQAAAALRRHDHLEPVLLEHLDRHHADAGLVVVGRAAVEVDDAAGRTGRPRPPSRPRPERPERERGQRGVAVDASADSAAAGRAGCA
jgi:hypothetical protein